MKSNRSAIEAFAACRTWINLMKQPSNILTQGIEKSNHPRGRARRGLIEKDP